MRYKLPIISRFLFKLFLDTYEHESLLGDLDEMFVVYARKKGRRRAILWYWRQLFRAVPVFLRNSFIWSLFMFKNYFKISFRAIKRQKIYSLINLSGLAIGMACGILLLNFVFYDLSFDRYHENSGRIFRVRTDLDLSGQTIQIPKSSPLIASALREDYPEVEETVRFNPESRAYVQYGNKGFFEGRIFTAEKTFFDVFSFPMQKGTPQTALAAPFSVVLTEESAKKYFSDEDPMGKVLKFDNQEDFTVTGVMKNVPKNSHFVFDMLCSYQSQQLPSRTNVVSWFDVNYYVYLRLRNHSDGAVLEQKFPAFIDKYIGAGLKSMGGSMKMSLQLLTSIHLHSHLVQELSANSDIVHVILFSLIAVFILLIACMNYMNLSTARSASRVREVGVRKVLGADRRIMITQFLGEAGFFSLFSFIIALVLARIALPLFNSLSGLELSLNYFEPVWFFPSLLGLAIFMGLAAGSYPAFFLSAFQPTRVLVGNMKAGAANFRFRNILVTVQFTLSVFLIIGTLIVAQQLQFMKNKSLGFNREQLVVLPIRSSQFRRSLEAFKADLKQHDSIVGAAASSHVPGQETFRNAFLPEGFSAEQAHFLGSFHIDHDYLPVMGMELAAGRNFSQKLTTDKRAILINEAAVKKFGWEQPLGKTIQQILGPNRLGLKGTVIGVVKDFHISSVRDIIEPLLITCLPRFSSLSVRIKSQNISETMGFLRTRWEEFNPGYVFEYFFLDSAFNSQYRTDERMGRIFSSFAILAIFIACLGLFGLVAFISEQRTKEIGIRKVLGASSFELVYLLTKEFTKWVIIANVLAWPFVYFMGRRWLQGFAYRTPLGLKLFLLAGGLSIIIAVITVSFQTLKAATANPVDALKYE